MAGKNSLPNAMSDTVFSWERLRGLFALSHDGIEWQHDVDYSPACALEMAKLEVECGIHSTYFFRPCSDEYNPFGPSVSDTISRIIALGHLIGTHVDLGLPRDYQVDSLVLKRRVTEQVSLLSKWFYPVSRKVSFHAPPVSVLGGDIEGFDSVHSLHWQDRWIGDSRGVWRENPEERIAEGVPLRVNLHPEWHFWPQHLADEWREREAAKP